MIDILEPGTIPHRLVVGIDLGTTHSLVAWVNEQGHAACLPDARGQTLLPSVVSFTADGLVNVGAPLPEALATISSAKRLVGRGLRDAAPLAARFGWTLTGSPEVATFQVGTQPLTPVEISAHILRTLKRRAEQHLGQEIFEAVITVPAYFDDAQRQATKDAAKLAGLNPLRLLPEPTAAALAYGLDSQAQGTFLVYDLGGGTFDVSVLRLVGGVFQVLATVGDTALGGDDLDHLIAAKLGCPNATARQLKEQLSTQPTATHQGFTLSQTALNTLAEPLVQKTLTLVQQALRDAELTAADLHGVVLAGGQSRMPLIRTRLSQALGCPLHTSLNPDEIVALGAARQADNLTRGKCAEFLLLDVTPLSLGLETMGGLVEKIIPRNTPIPITKAQDFTTFQDGQTAMKIHVVQGERELVADNRSLATFTLRGIPPMLAGQAKVQVVFALDADGLLTVTAKELTTQTTAQIEVQPSYGITEEQMLTMLKDSLTHAGRDLTARQLAEARLELERSLMAAYTALERDATQLTPAQTEQARQAIQRAKDSLTSLDPNHLEHEQKALEQAFMPLVERRMNQVLAAQVVGKNVMEFTS